MDRPTRPSARRKSGRFLRAPLRRQEGCTRWCRAGRAVDGSFEKKPNCQPQRGAGPKQPGDGSGGRCGLLRGRIAESRRKGIGTGEGCLPGLGQAGAVEKEIGQAIGVGHGAMIATRKSSCGRINPILNPSHCLYPNKNFLNRLLPAGALAAFTPRGQGRDCCHPDRRRNCRLRHPFCHCKPPWRGGHFPQRFRRAERALTMTALRVKASVQVPLLCTKNGFDVTLVGQSLHSRINHRLPLDTGWPWA